MLKCRVLVSCVVLWLVSDLVCAETLSEVVQYTLDHNPDVLADVKEVQSRQHEVDQAASGYLPSVDMSYGVGYENSNNSTTRADFVDHRELIRRESALTINQMLFDGFATRSEVDRQRARVASQQYRLNGVAGVTSLRAVEVYLAVLRSRQLLQLAEDSLLFHQQTYDQIKLRSDAGVGRQADLDQVAGRLALAQSNVAVEKSNLMDAETNYLRVVGVLPAAEMALPQAPGSLPASMELAVDKAVQQHPTLKSANADVLATQAQKAAASSAFYPRMDLELGATHNDNLDGTRGTNSDATVMLRLRYNLYNGGNDQARKKQTAVLIEEAKQVRDQTHRQVVESIRLSWNGYQATAMQLPYLQQHVSSSERSREAYRQQFNIGRRTLLDLLDAENELFRAKQALVQAQFDHLFAHFRIVAGTGELLGVLMVKLKE